MKLDPMSFRESMETTANGLTTCLEMLDKYLYPSTCELRDAEENGLKSAAKADVELSIKIY